MLHERRGQLPPWRQAFDAPLVDGAEERALPAVVGADEAVDAAAAEPQPRVREQGGGAAGQGHRAVAQDILVGISAVRVGLITLYII